MNFTEITTREAVYQVNKQELTCLPDVSMLPKDEADDVINSLELKRVIRALNTDPATGKVWKPNWNDRSTYKYSIGFLPEASDEKPGGFGFLDAYYASWYTRAIAGSRLCLESADRVYHIFEHFPDLLTKCYLIIEE